MSSHTNTTYTYPSQWQFNFSHFPRLPPETLDRLGSDYLDEYRDWFGLGSRNSSWEFYRSLVLPMSRCFPYPLPGFSGNGTRGVAAIESIKVCWALKLSRDSTFLLNCFFRFITVIVFVVSCICSFNSTWNERFISYLKKSIGQSELRELNGSCRLPLIRVCVLARGGCRFLLRVLLGFGTFVSVVCETGNFNYNTEEPLGILGFLCLDLNSTIFFSGVFFVLVVGVLRELRIFINYSGSANNFLTPWNSWLDYQN